MTDSRDSVRNCAELYTGIITETSSDIFLITNYQEQKASDFTFYKIY